MKRHLIGRRATIAGLLSVAAVGRSTALLASEAQDQEPLRRMVEVAQRLDQLHSVVVVYDGTTVFGRAFRGPPLHRLAPIKSVSKSLVALVTGIAIDRGMIESVDATLGELIPDLIPDGADPKVRSITVADLLTMQTGLERTSGPNYGAWVASSNWVADALSRPFVAEPGERFQYSTGSYHVLGVALAKAAGRSLLTLTRDFLGEPLGINVPPWTRDPQGHYLGGNNMALTPRTMTTIGEMVRQGGRHNDEAVVPSDWIERSLRPRTRSPFSGDEYGYGFFLTDLAGHDVAYARGYGGQMIYIVPQAKITVAITSDPTRPARSDGHVGDLHRLVADEIIAPLAS